MKTERKPKKNLKKNQRKPKKNHKRSRSGQRVRDPFVQQLVPSRQPPHRKIRAIARRRLGAQRRGCPRLLCWEGVRWRLLRANFVVVAVNTPNVVFGFIARSDRLGASRHRQKTPPASRPRRGGESTKRFSHQENAKQTKNKQTQHNNFFLVGPPTRKAHCLDGTLLKG